MPYGNNAVARDRPVKTLQDKSQLSERVAAYIREAIMAGQLRATEYIRTEQLASQLGVSVTPVREALMALHSEGAVRWEPRKGFRVVPLTPQDVSDLFEVQAFIAGELAARSVEMITPEGIRLLRQLQEDLEVAARKGDAETVSRLNHHIHRTINRSVPSSRLTALLNRTLHYVPGTNYYGNVGGWVEASAHDHDDIISAIERGDSDAARVAMIEHIRHSGKLLMAHLEERSSFDNGAPASGQA